MIKSFKHKGLEKFFTEGNTDDIEGIDEETLRYVLSVIDAADEIRDCKIPSLKFQKENKGFYSICVGNDKKLLFRLTTRDTDKEPVI